MCSKQARIFFACAMHESPILEDLLDMGLLLPQTHSFFLKREVNNRKAVKHRKMKPLVYQNRDLIRKGVIYGNIAEELSG